MEVFPPIHAGPHQSAVIFTIVAVLSILGSIVLLNSNKKKPPKQRMLRQMVAMLLFFVSLISASTAFFSHWRSLQLNPIEVQSTALLISGQEIPFENIRKIEIDQNPQPSLINQSVARQSAPLLKVHTNDQQLLVISKQQYDIESLFLALQKAVDTWRTQNEQG